MRLVWKLLVVVLLFHRQVLMVSTVQKTVEDPVEIQQVQIWDKVVDLAIVEQRQVPMVLTVQRPVEIPQVPQLQFIDKFVDISPVVGVRGARTRGHVRTCCSRCHGFSDHNDSGPAVFHISAVPIATATRFLTTYGALPTTYGAAPLL